MLILVPNKKPDPRKRYPRPTITAEENENVRVLLKNLCRAYGSWECLGDAMEMNPDSLRNVVFRNRFRASMMTVYRAALASGFTVEQVLSGKYRAADRCHACGQGRPFSGK